MDNPTPSESDRLRVSFSAASHVSVPASQYSSRENLALDPSASQQDCSDGSALIARLPSKQVTHDISRFDDGKISTVDDTWALEYVSIVACILCVVSIAIILLQIEGKVLSTWPLPIRPNALIAIFSVLLQGTMAYNITQSISQLKWLYFHHDSHQTIDMQLFEDASRGPWGSLLFVWHFRKRKSILVSMLCFTTIVASAVGPFTQQIITYPPRLAPSMTELALTPVATGCLAGSPISSENGPISVVSGIQMAFCSALDGRTGDPVFTCTSGNCSFPEVATLAVCSSCYESVDFTTVCDGSPDNEQICNMTTPSGLVVKRASGVLTQEPGSNFLPFEQEYPWWMLLSTARGKPDNDSGLIFGKFAVWKNTTSDRITECNLRLCERVYSPFHVTKGKANSTAFAIHELIESVDEVSVANSNDDLMFVQSTENGKKYAVDSGGVGGILLSLFLNFDVALLSDAGPSLLGSEGSVYGLEYGIYESENITTLAGNLSDRLTDYLRTADPVSISINNNTMGGNVTIDNVSIIPSTAFQTETYIQVTWVWFVLPSGLVLVTTVLFALTVSYHRSTHKALWKSSSLPYLYHPLQSEDNAGGRFGDRLNSLNSISQMERMAVDTKVRFAEVYDRRLVLVTTPE